jgi:hypothetical protein
MLRARRMQMAPTFFFCLKTNQAFFGGGPDLTADQKLIVVCQYKPAGKKKRSFFFNQRI